MDEQRSIRLPIRGVISDLDSTLVYSFDQPEREGEPMPHAKDLIQHLQSHQVPIRVATNQAALFWDALQGAIAFQKGTEYTWKKYPTSSEIIDKMVQSLYALGLASVPVFISVYDAYAVQLASPLPDGVDPQQIGAEIAESLRLGLAHRGIAANVSADPDWRKPGYKMLHAAQVSIEEVLGQQAIPHRHILYIGDMHSGKRQTDRWAAQNAGMQFLEAERITELLEISDFSVSSTHPPRKDRWRCLSCGHTYNSGAECPHCGAGVLDRLENI